MNNLNFPYSLCSTKNNLNFFQEQEYKTGLMKNSSFRFPIVETSRVTLRNRKFLQILHQIIKCLQWYFRKFNHISWAITVAATFEGKPLAWKLKTSFFRTHFNDCIYSKQSEIVKGLLVMDTKNISFWVLNG